MVVLKAISIFNLKVSAESCLNLFTRISSISRSVFPLTNSSECLEKSTGGKEEPSLHEIYLFRSSLLVIINTFSSQGRFIYWQAVSCSEYSVKVTSFGYTSFSGSGLQEEATLIRMSTIAVNFNNGFFIFLNFKLRFFISRQSNIQYKMVY